MNPTQELEEWVSAGLAEGWHGDDSDRPFPSGNTITRRRTIRTRYCLQCALPVDQHNARCSQNPDAINPIPWPSELGVEGGWVER